MKYQVYFKVYRKNTNISLWKKYNHHPYNIDYTENVLLSLSEYEYDIDKIIKDNFGNNLGMTLDSSLNSVVSEKENLENYNQLFEIYKGLCIGNSEDFYGWKFIKEINIENGELDENNKYEINGVEYPIKIIYNNESDKVELRVDYIVEILENENEGKIKDCFNSLCDKLKELREEYSKNYIDKRLKVRNDFNSKEIKQHRKTTKFLWLPRSIYGDTRWLRKATWEEERKYNKWTMTRWID